jgi:hypothetical protein
VHAVCFADLAAAEHFMQFQYGWIADPLYFGDYPKIMRDTQVGAAYKLLISQLISTSGHILG